MGAGTGQGAERGQGRAYDSGRSEQSERGGRSSQIPRSDVGIDAGAAGLAVRAKAEDEIGRAHV